MGKQKEITITFAQDEIERLQAGESFDWEYDGIKIHIKSEDNEEDEE